MNIILREYDLSKKVFLHAQCENILGLGDNVELTLLCKNELSLIPSEKNSFSSSVLTYSYISKIILQFTSHF